MCPTSRATFRLCKVSILEDLELQVDSTVVAQLANGKQYTLIKTQRCKAGFEANTRDGQVRVRWEGLACLEVNLF